MANSYTLPTGRVIPTETAEHVRAGIREAMGSHGTAADTDNEKFRQHLIRRSADHGMGQMIPPSWASSAAGKSAGQWSDARLLSETRSAVYDVAKRAGCTIRSMEIEIITPAEAVAALSKASDLRRMADRLTDLAAADSYRQLAKQTLERVGMA